MVSKVLLGIVALVLGARLFVRRDSELARRYRLFIDVSLLLLLVLYGARFIQLWLR